MCSPWQAHANRQTDRHTGRQAQCIGKPITTLAHMQEGKQGILYTGTHAGGQTRNSIHWHTCRRANKEPYTLARMQEGKQGTLYSLQLSGACCVTCLHGLTSILRRACAHIAQCQWDYPTSCGAVVCQIWLQRLGCPGKSWTAALTGCHHSPPFGNLHDLPIGSLLPLPHRTAHFETPAHALPIDSHHKKAKIALRVGCCTYCRAKLNNNKWCRRLDCLSIGVIMLCVLIVQNEELYLFPLLELILY